MPTRRIPIGNRAVTGLHARSGARYESSLERDFFELMSFDEKVISIEEQPVRIEYVDRQGKKRRYTPDVLVTFQSDENGVPIKPAMLCEIKYLDDYRKNFRGIKERLIAARKFARQKGWTFSVITDLEIRTQRLQNIRFLSGFKDRVPPDQLAACFVSAVLLLGRPSISSLLEHFSSERAGQAELLPFVWSMIFHGDLVADLSEPISMDTTLLRAD